MRKVTLPVIVLTGLTLSACAHKIVWNPPPGGDEAEFHRDNLMCTMAGKQVAGNYMAFGTPMMVAMAAAANRQEAENGTIECMLGKGYTIQSKNF